MNNLPVVEYDEIAQQMNEVKEYANFIPNASTDEGYQKSKRVSLDIGKLQTALEAKRKEKKAFYLEGGKLVDSTAKDLSSSLEEMQKPHMLAYKELDNIKKQREADRKAELESRVLYIRNLPSSLADSCSEEIQAAMNKMGQEECENFYEFTADALKARNETRAALATLFTETLKAEKDAQELALLRKQQAEREIKDREERIANEAKAIAEAAAKKAIDDANEAKQKAVDDKIKADKELLASQENARLLSEQAARDKANREQLAYISEAYEINDDIDRRVHSAIMAKQAEDRRVAEVEAARQSEIKRQEDEAELTRLNKEKLENDKKHVGAVRCEIKKHIMAGADIDENTARLVVLSLLKSSRITINY